MSRPDPSERQLGSPIDNVFFSDLLYLAYVPYGEVPGAVERTLPGPPFEALIPFLTLAVNPSIPFIPTRPQRRENIESSIELVLYLRRMHVGDRLQTAYDFRTKGGRLR
jgi:hypothetical protein